LKGRKPTKAEQEHMSLVAQQPCVVCKQKGNYNYRVEIHHINGRTKKDCHFDILPLCFEHHRKGNKDEPISRHPYKKRFVNAYGTEEELLQQVFVNTVKNNAPF
jgi:hypothetical protein